MSFNVLHNSITFLHDFFTEETLVSVHSQLVIHLLQIAVQLSTVDAFLTVRIGVNVLNIMDFLKIPNILDAQPVSCLLPLLLGSLAFLGPTLASPATLHPRF